MDTKYPKKPKIKDETKLINCKNKKEIFNEILLDIIKQE